MKSISKHITLLGFLLVFALTSRAQTFEIPDTNFRNVLKSRYPNVFQKNLLLTNEAKKVFGSLDIQNKNLVNLDGIQYFESLFQIDASYNQIIFFPDIQNLVFLQNLNLNYNQLKNLPNFSKNKSLFSVQIFANQLSQLPNFGSLQNLKQIYASDNKITTLGKIDSLVNLEILVVGNNPFEEYPNFSKVKKLVELHVHNTGMDTILGLDSLKNLRILYAWGNRIKSIAGLEKNTTLELLNVGTNRISSLPNLKNKPNLSFLNIDANFLSFEDLLNINTTNLKSFFYSPQKKFTIEDQIKREKTNATFSANFDKTVLDNIYVWKKSNILIDSSTSSSLQLKNLTKNNAGNYSLKIRNSKFPNLVLESYDFTLTVDTCAKLVNLNYRINSIDCKTNYSLDFENTQIEGGQKPYTYILSGSNYFQSTDNFYVSNVPSGKIELKIIDSRNCVVESEFELDKIANCDAVFSPNGDGIGETYYIDEKGKVEIYNTKRQKVAEFEAPFLWNGNNNAGLPLDAGLYALIVEGQKVIYVTLVK